MEIQEETDGRRAADGPVRLEAAETPELEPRLVEGRVARMDGDAEMIGAHEVTPVDADRLHERAHRAQAHPAAVLAHRERRDLGKATPRAPQDSQLGPVELVAGELELGVLQQGQRGDDHAGGAGDEDGRRRHRQVRADVAAVGGGLHVPAPEIAAMDETAGRIQIRAREGQPRVDCSIAQPGFRQHADVNARQA